MESPVKEKRNAVSTPNGEKNGAQRENFVILKDTLISPSNSSFDQLRTFLQEKISDGNGETLFEVGSGADDSVSGLDISAYEASVATLKTLTETLDADCVLLREKKCAKDCLQGQYLVRKRADVQDFMEVRVAVVGNVDAGKSTLLGVLTHGELDNGRGFARMKLFRHKHEMETGRTSSVGNDILGFDSQGKVVNKPDHGHLDWVKICEDSSKVITFIDLAGHERYLKTTVFGMTGHLPDFTMLMVGANAGVVGMTKEHLGLALALNVPVFVVVTKIDMCPPNSAGCRKVPLLVRNKDDVVVSATNFVSERLCPIFQVSNVSGLNLDLLTMFLNLLSSRTIQNDKEPAQFQIDDTYQVPGVGVVVSGTCMKGVIHVNDTLLLGPNGLGDFVLMPIKSIHRKRMPVREVRGGQTASFALKKIKISEVRKGQVLVDPSLNPTSCWEFKVFREGRTKAVGRVLEVIPKAASLQQIKNHKILKMVNKQQMSNSASVLTESGQVGDSLNTQAGVGVGYGPSNGPKKQRSRRGGKHRSRGINSQVNNTSHFTPNHHPPESPHHCTNKEPLQRESKSTSL
ncbi:GTP-binding protein 1 [Armadillidium vulgare]|nr:GTP-binding protein 1 [Armadillidium vulgare]